MLLQTDEYMDEGLEEKFRRIRKPRTEEQLRRISEVRTGLKHKPHKKHYWKEGHSEETKKKMAAAHLGKTLSAETRQKLSDLKKGRKLSEETKQKMSQAHKLRRCKVQNLPYDVGSVSEKKGKLRMKKHNQYSLKNRKKSLPFMAEWIG